MNEADNQVHAIEPRVPQQTSQLGHQRRALPVEERDACGERPSRRGEVVTSPRDDVADAPRRVRHVADVARDDMHVEEPHRLTRRVAGVEADVEASRPMAQLDR
jgi:hypothetical protein